MATDIYGRTLRKDIENVVLCKLFQEVLPETMPQWKTKAARDEVASLN